jgi:hypothetical protein
MSDATEGGPAGTTVTGVLGGRWRADVTGAGDVHPWDGSAALAWHVAADDRWHTPSVEAAVRQERVEGTPVVETRVRIPSGDALQRVWSVPDDGGLTLVSVTNESPLPIAIAFSRGDLLSVRAPSTMPIEGIDLPRGSVAFPVGHHTTITVGLAHRRGSAGQLPAVAPAEQVVRGWVAAAERAGRVVLPDPGLTAAIVGARCDLALSGAGEPDDDPVAFLLAAGVLVRMGEPADALMPAVATAVERLGRAAGRRRRRSATQAWDVGAALDAAADVARAAGHHRAVVDLDELRSRMTIDRTLPASTDDAPPADIGVARTLAWHERRLVDPAPPGRCHLLPMGLPAAWLGAGVEVHGLPAGDGASASFALRWHGERPAVLWELHGAAVLDAPVVAPEWSTAVAAPQPPTVDDDGTVRGEALWPAPAAPSVVGGAPLIITDDGGSFS